MSDELSVQEENILLGARDGLSYREMARMINRSKSWIQSILAGLIVKEYLEHNRYEHRTIALTQKAKDYLKERGISYERHCGDSGRVE